MQIILGVIFIVILIALLSQADVLTARGKSVIFAILMMIVASAILYEFMFSKTEEKNRAMINAFNQGKTIVCMDKTVTQDSYNLERGTLSFMAKPDKKELAGTIYSIKDCKIQE